MKKSKTIYMIILLYSLLSINVNLKQIIFLQRQIRKFLSYKNNQSKLFYRPQSKPKNNYLFLNSTDGQINKTNDLIYSESQFNSGDNVQNLNENNEQNERQSMNGDDDSVLNNEIKYVENLRIQNAIYTGQVLNGKRHGRGTQIWDDGAKYEGDWENDKSNGYGTFYHTDGDVYQGYWKNNRANGKGIYISADGGRYEGFWIDDVQNGLGTEKWNDGSSYKGNYNMGKKEGYGEYEWSNGCKYKGYWKDNKLCGLGVYYYSDGKKFIGEYNNNLKEGIGKYYWNDGKSYFGEFKQDKKDGIGKYSWNDGRMYLGFWKLNKQNGLGRYSNPNEQKEKFGIWVEGKRTQWLNEEEFKEESNEFHSEYIQIINFDSTFNETYLNEDEIVKEFKEI